MELSKSKPFNHVFGAIINDIHTDIVIHKFTNRLFILVTQFGKIPNIFVTQHAEIHVGKSENREIIINNKFGSDTDEIAAGIKYILKNTGLSEIDIEIVFSFALKKIDRNAVVKITEIIKNIL